jgi:sulfite exporter TauE/SafE
MLFLFSAITLGFFGSVHCLGMCGPIALALPLDRSSSASVWIGTLSYNVGRILTYSILGSLFGLMGKAFEIAGLQRSLTIAIGVLLLTTIFLPQHVGSNIRFKSVFHNFILRQKNRLGHLFSRTSLQNLFFIGLLNGLLPCGFVYLGLVASVASGGIFTGTLFMAAFGAGTLPAMASLSLVGNRLPISFRSKIRKATPFFIGFMAMLFILRGMNLGIPYLSPKLTTIVDIKHNCCHK